MDYESMSLEELEAENTRLSNKRAEIQTEQRAINEVMSRKTAERDMHAKYESMTAAERAALTQIVGVQTATVRSSAKKAGE
jgi:hypothetical protein